MKPSKNGKVLAEFNCKNGVYSVDGSTVKPLGYLSSVTLERSISADELYGDGEVILSLIGDKGSTGTLELTARDGDFEKDLGFLKDIEQGTAEVQVVETKTISIGFEAYVSVEVSETQKVTKTKKVWLLGVNVLPAGDSLSQNTDKVNQSPASYELKILGTSLKDSTGEQDAVDENGNGQKVFKITSLPGTNGYETFLDSVPTPKEKSE